LQWSRGGAGLFHCSVFIAIRHRVWCLDAEKCRVDALCSDLKVTKGGENVEEDLRKLVADPTR
jgi:hypothetical protein